MKNSQTKEKRFSVIDLFIALILLCAVLGMVLRAVGFDMGSLSGKEENFYITYEITGVDSEIEQSLTDGVAFYSDSEKMFGKNIGKPIITPAKIEGVNSNGEYVQSYSDGKTVDIKGTIEAVGVMTDRGLFLGGSYYQANMEISLYGGGALVSVLICDISSAS